MRPWIRLAVLCCLAATPALAVGPIDGEVNALWWVNETDVDTPGGSASGDGDAPGLRAEMWLFGRYGIRAAQFSSDVDEFGIDDSNDYTSVDLLWKAFAPTEHNFVAVGAGYEEMDLGLLGLDGDTWSTRLAVEGRVGFIGAVYGYLQGAYLPTIDDTSSVVPTVEFEDMDGYEYEMGVSWKFAPFVSLRAGYRETSIDFTQTDGLTDFDGTAESTGFVAGLGVHF
jgi:opacity protein-like surface antigen